MCYYYPTTQLHEIWIRLGKGMFVLYQVVFFNSTIYRKQIFFYGAQHLVTTNFVQTPILEIKKKNITGRNPTAHTAEFNFQPMVAAG